MNIVKDALNDAKTSGKRIYKVLRFFAIKMLIYRAKRLHRKHNIQVFVVKMNGEIRLLSKHQFKEMRNKGVFSLNFTATNLKKIAIYYTPKRYDKKGIKRFIG